MGSTNKLIVGIYSLTGCEGCRHEIINLGEKLLDAMETLGIELAYEPLLGLSVERSEYDVVFVEGSVTSEKGIQKLREIRSRCKYLVAMGSCSMLGGINAIASIEESGEELLISKYGKHAVRSRLAVPRGEPISKYVKVDYWLRGCPINGEEFLTLLRNIAEGTWFKQGLRRFEFVREFIVNIEGEVMRLDGEKCIVCGRCVGICNYIGVNALGTINRGIDVAVTTPFRVPFEEAGCISCGLCAKYCPVGALTYRDDVAHTQRLLASESMDAYIEPEALAAVAESFGVSPWKVVSGLKEIGFRRVIVWEPVVDVGGRELTIVPGSEAEYRFVKQFYPDLRKYLVKPPRLPEDGVVITSCVARKLQGSPVLTAREAEKMLARLNIINLPPTKPDIVAVRPKPPYAKAVGPYEVRGVLEAVSKRYIKEGAVAIYICPGGCLMGGGQPYPKTELGVIEEARAKLYAQIFKELGIPT